MKNIFLAILFAFAVTSCEIGSDDSNSNGEPDPQLLAAFLGEPNLGPQQEEAVVDDSVENEELLTGSDQFLWKPISESTGNLVILTPFSSTNGQTQGFATISGAFGSERAELRHEDKNGNRPHFYFDNPGASYGTEITVQVPLQDGSVFSQIVPVGSQRFEP